MLEVLREALHEIVAKPLVFLLELAQFAALVFIIKAIAFGLGGKSGTLTNMLAERRRRIGEQLDGVRIAEESLRQAHMDSVELVAVARTEAAATIRSARANAAAEAANTDAAAAREAEEVMAHAEQALAKERSEVLDGIRGRLVDVVAQATRQILDGGLPPAEQRARIQDAVLGSIDDLDAVGIG